MLWRSTARRSPWRPSCWRRGELKTWKATSWSNEFESNSLVQILTLRRIFFSQFSRFCLTSQDSQGLSSWQAISLALYDNPKVNSKFGQLSEVAATITWCKTQHEKNRLKNHLLKMIASTCDSTDFVSSIWHQTLNLFPIFLEELQFQHWTIFPTPSLDRTFDLCVMSLSDSL